MSAATMVRNARLNAGCTAERGVLLRNDLSLALGARVTRDVKRGTPLSWDLLIRKAGAV